MTKFDPIRHKAATAVFKLAIKTQESGMHRTLDRDPKGKGWVKCGGVFEGFWYKPDKVKETIEYFKIAYEVFPDIVALNQIALVYEMVGEDQLAVEYYRRMKDQARLENNDVYIQTAELGLGRCE
jgi:hypothetical protein